MRKLLVAGNWKMNGSIELAKTMLVQLSQTVSNCEHVESMLFPSFVHLSTMLDMVQETEIGIGAQNVSQHSSGAFTGEVSLSMLKDIGISTVLLGHSERRTIYNESDELIFEKTKLAIEQGFNVVFCVGESLEERETGVTNAVVEAQLTHILNSPKLDGIFSFDR